MTKDYGICKHCGVNIEPIISIVPEVKSLHGYTYLTGKVVRVVDYLQCPCCLRKECVDGSDDVIL